MGELLQELLSSPDVISGFISQYKPVIYAVCSELFSIYKDLVNNEEYFVYSAKYDWNRMATLMDAGFSRDEAFAILLSDKEHLRNMEKFRNFKTSNK